MVVILSEARPDRPTLRALLFGGDVIQPDHLLCIDFETFYDKLFSLSKMTTEEYVRSDLFSIIGVGVDDGEEKVWFEEADFRAWAATVPWDRCAVLCHNVRFDSSIMSWHYGTKPLLWLCTLSMGRALHGIEVGGSLRKLALHYGVGEKGDEVIRAIGKRRADFTQEEWLTYGEYCKNDTHLCKGIFNKMIQNGFPDDELRLIDLTTRMFTEPKLEIDQEKISAFIADEKKRKAGLLERIEKDKSVVMSNDKLAQEFLALGIQPPTKISVAKTKTAREKDPEAEDVETWAFAKSDPEFQALLEHERDEVRWLAEARLGLKSTINETRSERLLNIGRRGALPVPLNYCGAHTFRWAGTEKINTQNFQRGGVIRDCLLAPEGYVVVAADSGQIEARVTAWLAEHQELIDAFASGRDVYCEFGSSVFGREITKDDKRERQISKICVLALGFSMGWYKLSANFLSGKKPTQFTLEDAEELKVNVGRFMANESKVARVEAMPSRLPLEERLVHCAVCEALVWKYRNKNAPITELWKAMEAIIEAMEAGEELDLGVVKTVRHGLVLPSGLVMRYPGLRQSDDGYSYLKGYGKERTRLYGGAMTENVVQAVSRVIIGEQMIKVAELGYPIATCVHDEIVLVVPEAQGQKALDDTIGIMKIAPAWAEGLPLNANGGFGRSYGDAK